MWAYGRGQTHRHTHRQTHRRAWPQYILRRLRLTQNVKKYCVVAARSYSAWRVTSSSWSLETPFITRCCKDSDGWSEKDRGAITWAGPGRGLRTIPVITATSWPFTWKLELTRDHFDTALRRKLTVHFKHLTSLYSIIIITSRSIAMRVSVCLSARTRISQKLHVQTSRNFSYVLPGPRPGPPLMIVECYILPVLWMTCLPIVGPMSCSEGNIYESAVQEQIVVCLDL